MPVSLRDSDRQTIKLLLIAAARKFTGRSRYAALSELLSSEEKDVTPEALNQLARDNASFLKELQASLESILAMLLQPGP
jgi:hypothetical protein